MKPLWQDLLLPEGNVDVTWELFHENSKRSRYDPFLSSEEVIEEMCGLHQALPFEGYPVVKLPSSLIPLTVDLDKVLISRHSASEMTAASLTLEQVATLLHYGYGLTRTEQKTSLPRPRRIVPSAGALFPLEIFVHSIQVQGLKAGLYHFNPQHHHLRLLDSVDRTTEIASAMVQPELPGNASLIIFITAIFERAVFKYGDRGYRFVLIEAGHVAQNINLVANALNLGSLNIGGYFDREIDEILDLDGLSHSTIYIVAVGSSGNLLHQG